MIREAPKAPPVYGQDGTSRFDPLPSASGAEKATIAAVTPTLSPNLEGDMPLTPESVGQDVSLGLIKVGVAALLGRIFGPQRLWWITSGFGVVALLALHFAWPTEILTLRDAACIMGGALVTYGGVVGLHWRGVQIPLLVSRKPTTANVVPAEPTHTPLVPWVRAFLIDAELNRASGGATAKIGLVTNAPEGASLHSAAIQGALEQLAPISLRLKIGSKRYNLTAPNGVPRLEIPPGSVGVVYEFTMEPPREPPRIGLTDDTTDTPGEGTVVTQNLGELPLVGTVRITGKAG